MHAAFSFSEGAADSETLACTQGHRSAVSKAPAERTHQGDRGTTTMSTGQQREEGSALPGIFRHRGQPADAPQEVEESLPRDLLLRFRFPAEALRGAGCS